jgi:hypothetical protein
MSERTRRVRPLKLFLRSAIANLLSGVFFAIGCVIVERIDNYYDNSPTLETLDSRSRSVGFAESTYPIARQQRPSGGGARSGRTLGDSTAGRGAVGFN